MANIALRIHAGPRAYAQIRAHGLQPDDVRVVCGAAGGPKGLILNPLDQYLFGTWLARSTQSIDLIGASIGAWRMATATLADPVAAFARLAQDYIHQEYALDAGRTLPTPRQVTDEFGREIDAFFAGRIPEVLAHARYRLHIVTTHGRHVLRREGAWRTPLGYLGAAMSNAISRRALGAWVERVVFSSPGAHLPVQLDGLPHRLVALSEQNFAQALLASCSVPFALKAVHDIPGAPRGAYWDGGITDYHLHWNYRALPAPGLVLYPHFQRTIVPGWLDKPFKRRHRPTPALDNVVVLAPDPHWVRALPGGKLPDREDFKTYAAAVPARVQAWTRAVSESERLAEEFARWIERPDPARVEPL